MQGYKQLRAAVLVNWVVDKPFGFSINLNKIGGWVVTTIGGPFPRKINLLSRIFLVWPGYALVPLKVLFVLRRFDVIIAWQQVYGIALALLIRLLQLKPSVKICILSFIIKPAKQKGTFRKVINYALQCSCVHSIICYNETEMAQYKKLFPNVAHKFSSAILSEDIEDIQSFQMSDGDYYVAAGRSNRDNNFLIDYFSKHPARKLHLITDQMNSAKLPSNVLLFDNTFGRDYLQQIAGCKAIVMAFKDDTMSSGQLVFLHALQFGKPVVATHSKCLTGYIIHELNGLEINKDINELEFALQKLDDENCYKLISSNGLRDYEQRFGFAQLASRVIEVVLAE